GNVVYAVTEKGGLLHALDATTGKELWNIVTGTQWDWRSSSPVFVDGTLYIGSNVEGFLAFEDQ
nr:PQQ-binding-like beta-propeller repeat protein [Anaerolineae bacterium]